MRQLEQFSSVCVVLAALEHAAHLRSSASVLFNWLSCDFVIFMPFIPSVTFVLTLFNPQISKM